MRKLPVGAPRRLACSWPCLEVGTARSRSSPTTCAPSAREDEAVSPRATAPGETITRFDEDHLELSKKLGGAAPYFAPTYQKYKAGFIWVLAFVLEAYALTVKRSWALATCLAFLYAMIGLNIQHE